MADMFTYSKAIFVTTLYTHKSSHNSKWKEKIPTQSRQLFACHSTSNQGLATFLPFFWTFFTKISNYIYQSVYWPKVLQKPWANSRTSAILEKRSDFFPRALQYKSFMIKDMAISLSFGCTAVCIVVYRKAFVRKKRYVFPLPVISWKTLFSKVKHVLWSAQIVCSDLFWDLYS